MKISGKIKGVVFASLLALVASTSGAIAAGGAPSPSTVSKSITKKPITLRVFTTAPQNKVSEAVAKEFQKKYPNIKVVVQATDFPNYSQGIQLALKSKNGPDVALAANAFDSKNGLTLNLAKYSRLYGWNKTIPSTIAQQWKVTEDYKSMAGSIQVALPTNINIVGLYYNKALLKQAGITTPPVSMEDFEKALAAAKKAGLVPLQMGNSQGHAAFLVQGIGQATDGAKSAAKWALGVTGSTFDTAGNKLGASKLLAWKEAGYIPSDVNSYSLQDAVKNFTQGQGVFLNDGNWDAGTIDAAMGDNVGFIPFPGKNVVAIGGGDAFQIASNSKNKDAAAAFLDMLISAQAAPLAWANGFLPTNVGSAKGSTSLQNDILKAYGNISKANGIVSFNNNVTSSMNQTLTTTTQALLGGQMSVATLISTVQADWASSR
ncbi:MAG: extracellular solute-binding protein [Actinobacteria bacterium]|jgi:ABC-type glycerol-3-phosphate transport system substrate-binding protein|nr:extracellular solute-binding protein [Actinomycetota bacterium]